MKPIIYAALICGAMMCVGYGRGNASLATYPKHTITYDLPTPRRVNGRNFSTLSTHTINKNVASQKNQNTNKCVMPIL